MRKPRSWASTRSRPESRPRTRVSTSLSTATGSVKCRAAVAAEAAEQKAAASPVQRPEPIQLTTREEDRHGLSPCPRSSNSSTGRRVTSMTASSTNGWNATHRTVSSGCRPGTTTTPSSPIHRREISLIYYNNRGGLEDRVFRIKTDRSSATSLPEPRTSHNISNVEIISQSASTVELRFNWLTLYYRYQNIDPYFGTCLLHARRRRAAAAHQEQEGRPEERLHPSRRRHLPHLSS